MKIFNVNETPRRRVAIQPISIVGPADPADMAVGTDEADGASRDAIGGGESNEWDMALSTPVGDDDWRRPITMNLPIETAERRIVILPLEPGEAVPAMKAAHGAGA